MTRIGFIGTGHIAAPMVRFLQKKGHQITVSERNAETARSLNASHGVDVADNQSVLEASEIVFLCVRPHVAEEVLAPLVFRADHKVVSVMAGVPLNRLRKLCAPAHDITMTIPLGYLENGGCPLAACPSADTLATLFEPENAVLGVEQEAAFNQHFAVCAFVPAVLDLMATASDWLGNQTGDPHQAAVYTRQLINGFLASMPEGGTEVLTSERDALATEGTLSLQ
ncbi:MAG: NAD(P)-binding domain-containing protein, partial [Pseudomonadota bacterium]